MPTPVLRHIANLWTLMQHPSRDSEWPLARKLHAIKEAGFDGVCWAPSDELTHLVREMGLIFVGGMAPKNAIDVRRELDELARSDAHHVNVQLGDDQMPTPQALELTSFLLGEAEELGLEPAIETHRGTCTETSEKMYALADAYEKLTGRLLPVSWDFSHFAVVKHLVPANFIERLLARPDLIQRAQQFHFRPFNGHHVQVPVTDGRGNLTPEVREWLPFAQAILLCWFKGNRNTGREIFICPEMGPVDGGYNLSVLPNAWDEARSLRNEIQTLWQKLH